jgi:hypothetical protein
MPFLPFSSRAFTLFHRGLIAAVLSFPGLYQIAWAHPLPAAKPIQKTAASALKRQARSIESITLLDESNHVVGSMDPTLLAATKKAIAHARLNSDSVAATPAPWHALLQCTLRHGMKVYAQLIYDQTLRVRYTTNLGDFAPTPIRPRTELIVEYEDGRAIWDWIQGILGPTREKSYFLPNPFPLPGETKPPS